MPTLFEGFTCPKAYPWKGFAIKSFNRLTALFSVTRASFQMYLMEGRLSNAERDAADCG